MMKHKHRGSMGCHFTRSDTPFDRDSTHSGRHGFFGGGGHGRGRGRRGPEGRLFDYGDLRLLVLAMIAEEPRHGYQLIKAIEDRFGGSYTPSPGVIYPTLSWLNDMGYADVLAEGGGRKRYTITVTGAEFLAENRAAADALLARNGDAPGTGNGGGRGNAPAPVVRAMENLKVAMRLRMRQGSLDQANIDAIAAALDAAAQAVERS